MHERRSPQHLGCEEVSSRFIYEGSQSFFQVVEEWILDLKVVFLFSTKDPSVEDVLYMIWF